MKLVGSRVEEEIRKTMINSHKSLFENGDNMRLLSVLKNNFKNMKTAYFINHTPEQDIDIYQLVIDMDTIVVVELERYNLVAEPLVKKMSIKQYKQRISKIRQIELAVALDLVKNDLVE